MSVEDCGNVALPSWSYSINTIDAEQQDANDPASRIAALLLAKLADYVVPGWSSVPSKYVCREGGQIFFYKQLKCQRHVKLDEQLNSHEFTFSCFS